MKFKITHHFYNHLGGASEDFVLYEESTLYSTGWNPCGFFKTREDAVKFAKQVKAIKEPDYDFEL